MITAELATRVAEAFDSLPVAVRCHMRFSDLSGSATREIILAIVESVLNAERAHHKADLNALHACVQGAIGRVE